MDKRKLTRIVSSSDSGIAIDLSGKKNGRGAYLCGEADCWEKALTSGLLDKAFQVQLTSEERQAIFDQRPS